MATLGSAFPSLQLQGRSIHANGVAQSQFGSIYLRKGVAVQRNPLSLKALPRQEVRRHGAGQRRDRLLCSSSPLAAVSTGTEEADTLDEVVSPEQPKKGLSPEEIQEHVTVLKQAAASRKVPPFQVFSALHALEKARIDCSGHLKVLGGDAAPGRTWMLVFNVDSKLKKPSEPTGPNGGYFPITAVQRFNAADMEVENGVFLGPVGQLTFRGPISWTPRSILYFTYNTLSIRLGSLKPFSFNIGKKEDEGRKPGEGALGRKDPFFTWFFISDEIAAARGRGGGVAYWVSCKRVE
eukprot:TRINITY_DN36190_c0_g1_i1.p1 TRINITY_DN36190_c0_g1~~TRINITY_DN36190_c0_g1_i1.p1  ORF type:complete len:294 (+),score=53.78 TRINITY_DN36190_c0_g1_i1:66-947(+)